MINIHLVRHGETDWNREGRCQGQSESQLNETGRAQAAAMQEQIRELNPTAIYVSSAVRTRQTADLLTALIDVPHQHRDDLREIHLGPWETRLWDELESAHPMEVELFRTEQHRFELAGAESFHQLQKRGVSAIEDIIAQEQNG
ncbi:MAG: histidine phosphatase family protein, partial [Granulosicoccus sp.]|nr:histidine phosphatase family protein [Granulosicoccus sp.]